MMTASQRARGRLAGLCRAVRRAFAALGYTHAEQILMQEAWWQVNRAAVPETGPLAWVLTLDGYRLAGSHLPAPAAPAPAAPHDPGHARRPPRYRARPRATPGKEQEDHHEHTRPGVS
jgi:hypothetical protein